MQDPESLKKQGRLIQEPRQYQHCCIVGLFLQAHNLQLVLQTLLQELLQRAVQKVKSV